MKKHIFFLNIIVFIMISYNLYYIFLIPQTSIEYLIYLDILIVVIFGMPVGGYIYKIYQKEKYKKEMLERKDLITLDMNEYENIDIARHDYEIHQQQLQQQYELHQNLEDYITKCCHEIKLPLSAAMLMTEQIENDALKEQLEKINQQLNTILVGCKVQSSLYDIQYKTVSIKDCMNTSIKNNKYFLIKNHFHIHIDLNDEYVYSDKEWLVYIFDQLIANTIKYSQQTFLIKVWCETKNQKVILYYEDHGEGIRDYDIPRIFERGYTGHNHHNGQYKSTGMGLYMVKLIINRLGHQIHVESEYGKYTRFIITFDYNEDILISNVA